MDMAMEATEESVRLRQTQLLLLTLMLKPVMEAMVAMDTTEGSVMLKLMPIMDMAMVAMGMEAMAAMDMEAMVAMDTTEESVKRKLMLTTVMAMVVVMAVMDTAMDMVIPMAMDTVVNTQDQILVDENTTKPVPFRTAQNLLRILTN